MPYTLLDGAPFVGVRARVDALAVKEAVISLPEGLFPPLRRHAHARVPAVAPQAARTRGRSVDGGGAPSRLRSPSEEVPPDGAGRARDARERQIGRRAKGWVPELALNDDEVRSARSAWGSSPRVPARVRHGPRGDRLRGRRQAHGRGRVALRGRRDAGRRGGDLLVGKMRPELNNVALADESGRGRASGCGCARRPIPLRPHRRPVVVRPEPAARHPWPDPPPGDTRGDPGPGAPRSGPGRAVPASIPWSRRPVPFARRAAAGSTPSPRSTRPSDAGSSTPRPWCGVGEAVRNAPASRARLLPLGQVGLLPADSAEGADSAVTSPEETAETLPGTPKTRPPRTTAARASTTRACSRNSSWQLTDADWAALQADYSSGTKANHPASFTGTIDGEVVIIDDAAVRLSGNPGFSWMGPKMQFTISFTEYNRTGATRGFGSSSSTPPGTTLRCCAIAWPMRTCAISGWRRRVRTTRRSRSTAPTTALQEHRGARPGVPPTGDGSRGERGVLWSTGRSPSSTRRRPTTRR